MSCSCLIISTNEVVTPYPVYPLGAAYIAGALRRGGYSVSHYDMLADGGRDGLSALLTREKFDVVGFSIRNLGSEDSSDPGEFLGSQKEIASELRRFQPEAVMVLGGAGFSIMPEAVMELFGADYGIVGEGEELVPWLVGEIAAGRKPLERLFRAKAVKNVVKGVELSPATAAFYISRGGMLNLQTKRGCSHGCSYCSYPKIEGRQVRYRDPDDVAEEALRLEKEYGAKHLFFADSVFNDNEGRYLHVAEALMRHGVSLPWTAFFRPQGLTVEGLRLLKRSGLASIELGSDGATDVTLKGFCKGFSFSDILASQQLITAENIPVAHFFMFGGPGETEETLREGLKNIEMLDPAVVFVFVGIRILPGTGIYMQALADGLIDETDDLLEPKFYFSPQVEKEEVDRAVRSSFASRIDRIYPCHGFNEKIVMLHKLGQTGPLWDLLLRMKA